MQALGETKFRKDDGAIRSQRTWLLFLLAGYLCLAPAVVFVALMSARPGGAWSWMVVTSFVAGEIAILVVHDRWLRVGRGKVRADADGVWLDGRCVRVRADISAAYVVEGRGSPFVRVEKGMHSPLEMVVHDHDEGERLISAMRLDAGATVARYRMNHGTLRQGWRSAALTVLPAMLCAGAFVICIPFAWPSVLAIAFALLAWAIHQIVTVGVGADGVRVRRWLGRSRFVPFATIERVTTDGCNMTIDLRDGTAIAMFFGFSSRSRFPGNERFVDAVRGLTTRIEQGLSRHRAETPSSSLLLERGGRTPSEWLRDLATTNGAYRTASPPLEELWRLIENHTALPTARLGAALMLRHHLDSEGRIRLGRVAEASAAPRFRAALDAIALVRRDESLISALELVGNDAE